MNNKYSTLLRVLDQIRMEAPLKYSKYRPKSEEVEKMNYAKSRAFIHLFLKVNFGLLNFEEREHFITDKGGDGGVDAYYIDKESKIIYLIQSKFRNNSVNFEEKEITLEELVKMEIKEILEGEINDASGIEYNGKIKQLQREVSEICDIGRYNYRVIILANLKKVNESQLKKITGGFDVTVFDYLMVYEKLLFPMISGTYYNKEEIRISINLKDKSTNENVTYRVESEHGECEITILFVPVSEIAKILYQYKNSILEYNPRAYLEMIGNPINRNIYDSIVNKKTNDFALLNNGITILSEETHINNKVGTKGKAQLIIKSPQIINGGQTSFTLSRIHEEILNNVLNEDVFNEKEVLLKIVTINNIGEELKPDKLNLIEAISKSTNNQSIIKESDRRSNDKVQIVLQEKIYKEYGIYYERKKGEYADGVKNGYITRNEVIERTEFIKLALASHFPNLIDNYNPKNISENKLFEEKLFPKILEDGSKYKKFMFMYFSYIELKKIKQEESNDKKDKFSVLKYGRALRYGDFAVIMINKLKFYNENFSKEQIRKDLLKVLAQWKKFEEYAFELRSNLSYFNKETSEINYYGYYKSPNIINDLISHFVK